MQRCKICDGTTTHFGEQKILMRHLAEYRRCDACGYLFVVAPDWLEEAYSTAITALDTGIVKRNLWLADATCALLKFSLPEVRAALDYGGGSGLFVRLMRDRGYRFSWRDNYSPNLLARGFEARAGDSYDLLTAFELVEHLPEPMPVFEEFRALAPRMLLSTELVPADVKLGRWWYFAPEAGQHIGFFTRASFDIVAERLGMRFFSNGRNLHVISGEAVSERLLRLLRKPARAAMIGWAGRRRSLAHADAAMLEQRLRS